ncbi:hypothetical protein PGT21_023595 [Puccinia graminis f. sp. tritici]|uniref:Uncharacterized protein n=1 Tax=Puccinia graminis f. sp. tritici TaxID=56615 RepID=A0A5B0MIB2_PUCGR|nr:hypothetical protein PGT21_023595 [Puccinia graminis f. sp. tritici]
MLVLDQDVRLVRTHPNMGVFRSSRAFELKSLKLMPNTSSATMFVTEDHTSYPEWKTSGTAVRVPSWQHHPSRR